MALDKVIHKGVKTAFKVLRSMVHQANLIVSKKGFGTVTKTTYPISIIVSSFEENDVQFLSFSSLIQPQDLKGMIPGEQLPALVLPSSGDQIEILGSSVYTGVYSVPAHDTDAVKGLVVTLLRRV